MDSRIERLAGWFSGRGRALIALSGGVDSALVAYAAHARLGDDCAALTADYMTLSRDEMDSARRVCAQIGIRHVIISYNELDDERFAENGPDRCFRCRMQLGLRLREYAEDNSFQIVADGTNPDDLGDYRPGIRAMREHGVRSPLLETNLSKREIRAAARSAGLEVHDRPSNSCLASRIPWGTRVTAGRLARIEAGEAAVRAVTGTRIVRVRDYNGSASIELEAGAAELLPAGEKREISHRLRAAGFDAVKFDPAGYVQGKANAVPD